MEVACYAKCSMFSNPTKTEDTRHEPNQHDVIMSGSACVATEDIHVFVFLLFFFSVIIKSSRCGTTGSLHLMKQNAVQQTVSHDKGPEPAVAWSGCLSRSVSQSVLWE